MVNSHTELLIEKSFHLVWLGGELLLCMLYGEHESRFHPRSDPIVFFGSLQHFAHQTVVRKAIGDQSLCGVGVCGRVRSDCSRKH